ncbi:hypothetical protein U0070_013234 [Myodes glareolus]|uniref:Uncharacterized protein n=1 Tax=Myodes glareolus TaxID=447135 RepID=A0AAW0I3T4_MYOGA
MNSANSWCHSHLSVFRGALHFGSHRMKVGGMKECMENYNIVAEIINVHGLRTGSEGGLCAKGKWGDTLVTFIVMVLCHLLGQTRPGDLCTAAHTAASRLICQSPLALPAAQLLAACWTHCSCLHERFVSRPCVTVILQKQSSVHAVSQGPGLRTIPSPPAVALQQKNTVVGVASVTDDQRALPSTVVMSKFLRSRAYGLYHPRYNRAYLIIAKYEKDGVDAVSVVCHQTGKTSDAGTMEGGINVLIGNEDFSDYQMSMLGNLSKEKNLGTTGKPARKAVAKCEGLRLSRADLGLADAGLKALCCFPWLENVPNSDTAKETQTPGKLECVARPPDLNVPIGHWLHGTEVEHLIAELRQTKGRKQTANGSMCKTSHSKWEPFPPTFLFVHRERPAVTKSCFCTHYHPFIRKEDKTLTKEQMIRGHCARASITAMASEMNSARCTIKVHFNSQMKIDEAANHKQGSHITDERVWGWVPGFSVMGLDHNGVAGVGIYIKKRVGEGTFCPQLSCDHYKKETSVIQFSKVLDCTAIACTLDELFCSLLPDNPCQASPVVLHPGTLEGLSQSQSWEDYTAEEERLSCKIKELTAVKPSNRLISMKEWEPVHSRARLCTAVHGCARLVESSRGTASVWWFLNIETEIYRLQLQQSWARAQGPYLLLQSWVLRHVYRCSVHNSKDVATASMST